MLRNLTFVVKFRYFCIRLNKGREQQKKFSLVEQLLRKFLRNYGKLLRTFRATCGKLEDWDLVHQTLSVKLRWHDVRCRPDVCDRLQPPRAICSLYHTTHEKLSGIV